MPLLNDHRDGPRDECGVFGIYAPDHDVARLAYFALFALQHRGQESAGIATAPRGGRIMAIRDQGLVAQVFNEHTLRSLVGDLATGPVRYSTTGSSEWENSPPIARDDHGTLALGMIEEPGGTASYCVASESCAFDLIGARYLREVQPGEMVILTRGGVRTKQVAEAERHAFCVFEYIYFARPDSKVAGTVLQV